MGKGLISVNKSLAPAFETAQRVVVNECGRTTFKGVVFPNGVKIGMFVQVPNFSCKADYKNTGVLNTLVNCGFSKQEVANYCGVAYSYVTKLLRQK